MADINPESQVIFSDLNPELNITSNYELVFNEDSIQASIQTICGTAKKTRPFRRSFGVKLMNYLFDPLDASTAFALQNELFQQITNEEQRLQLDFVEVLPDYDLNAYYVNVSGTIPRLQNKSFDFAFNLKRMVNQ